MRNDGAAKQAEIRLIERLRAGDPEAVSELVETYGAMVAQLAFRYLKNWEDAEEVAQDVLLKAVRNIDAFRGASALSSWLYRITFNAAMSRLRNGRFSRPHEVLDPSWPPTASCRRHSRCPTGRRWPTTR